MPQETLRPASLEYKKNYSELRKLLDGESNIAKELPGETISISLTRKDTPKYKGEAIIISMATDYERNSQNIKVYSIAVLGPSQVIECTVGVEGKSLFTGLAEKSIRFLEKNEDDDIKSESRAYALGEKLMLRHQVEKNIFETIERFFSENQKS